MALTADEVPAGLETMDAVVEALSDVEMEPAPAAAAAAPLLPQSTQVETDGGVAARDPASRSPKKVVFVSVEGAIANETTQLFLTREGTTSVVVPAGLSGLAPCSCAELALYVELDDFPAEGPPSSFPNFSAKRRESSKERLAPDWTRVNALTRPLSESAQLTGCESVVVVVVLGSKINIYKQLLSLRRDSLWPPKPPDSSASVDVDYVPEDFIQICLDRQLDVAERASVAASLFRLQVAQAEALFLGACRDEHRQQVAAVLEELRKLGCGAASRPHAEAAKLAALGLSDLLLGLAERAVVNSSSLVGRRSEEVAALFPAVAAAAPPPPPPHAAGRPPSRSRPTGSTRAPPRAPPPAQALRSRDSREGGAFAVGSMNLSKSSLGLVSSGQATFQISAGVVAALSLEVPLLTRGHKAEERLPVLVHALAQPPAAWRLLGRGAGGAHVPPPTLLLAGGDLAVAARPVTCWLHSSVHSKSGMKCNFLAGTSALFSKLGAPLSNAKPGDELVLLRREPSKQGSGSTAVLDLYAFLETVPAQALRSRDSREGDVFAVGSMNLSKSSLGLTPRGKRGQAFGVPFDLVAALSLEVPLLPRGHKAEEGLPVLVHALAQPPAAWRLLGRGAGGAHVPPPTLLLAGGDLAVAAWPVTCWLHTREEANFRRTRLAGAKALFSQLGAPLQNAKPGDELVLLRREPSKQGSGSTAVLDLYAFLQSGTTEGGGAAEAGMTEGGNRRRRRGRSGGSKGASNKRHKGLGAAPAAETTDSTASVPDSAARSRPMRGAAVVCAARMARVLQARSGSESDEDE